MRGELIEMARIDWPSRSGLVWQSRLPKQFTADVMHVAGGASAGTGKMSLREFIGMQLVPVAFDMGQEIMVNMLKRRCAIKTVTLK